MSITYASLDQLLASPFQRLTSGMWNTATLTLIQLYQSGGNAVTSVLKNGNLYLPGDISAVTGDFLYHVYVQGQPVLTENDPIYVAGFIDLAGSQIAQIVYNQQQIYKQLGYLPQDIYNNLANIIVPSIYENVANAIQTKEVTQKLSQLPYQIYDAILDAFGVSKLATLLRQELEYLPGNIYHILSTFLSYFYSQTVALTTTMNRLALYLAPTTVQGLQIKIGTTPAPIYTGPSIQTAKVLLQNLSNYVVYIGNSVYNQFPILPSSSLEFNITNPANVYAWATGPTTIYALFEEIS